MKHPIKLLAFFFLALMVACQPKNTEENTETEVSGTAGEISENMGSDFINPNLATKEDLISAGLSEKLAEEVIALKPILNMMDLHALLLQTLDQAAIEALYAKMFVPFNLNTTPETDFKIIPGVGDRMAHEFEEYRPYMNLAQFRKEIGKYVDEQEVARFEHYVFVPVELNTAAEEDILSLPGVGSRMAHEFEEYRPYTSMEQFRKEIGKYVDDQELARLERFVYLK